MALHDATEFANPVGIDWQGDVGWVNYGGGGMVCTFYLKHWHHPAKSTEAGRPVYEDKVYVKIHAPGDRLNIVDRPAHDGDKRRFPREWQQFSQNVEQIGEGTPIEMLHPGNPSIAATLKGHGVHTIEKCAQLSGVAIDTIGMGGQRWHNDAVRYIEVANKGVTASKLGHELDERDSEIRVLKQQLGMLKGEVERLSMAGNNEQLAQMQKMLMGMAQRPQMQTPVDTSMAMINANHPTADIAKRRGRPPGAKNKLKPF